MLISPRLSVRHNPRRPSYLWMEYTYDNKRDRLLRTNGRADLDKMYSEYAIRKGIKSIAPAQLKSPGSLLHRWVVLDALYSITHGLNKVLMGGKGMKDTVIAWLLDPSPHNLEAVKKWARAHDYYGPEDDVLKAIIDPRQALGYAVRAATLLADNPDWVETSTDDFGNEIGEDLLQDHYNSALVPYKQACAKRATERYGILTTLANAHVLPELNAEVISEILGSSDI